MTSNNKIFWSLHPSSKDSVDMGSIFPSESISHSTQVIISDTWCIKALVATLARSLPVYPENILRGHRILNLPQPSLIRCIWAQKFSSNDASGPSCFLRILTVSSEVGTSIKIRLENLRMKAASKSQGQFEQARTNGSFLSFENPSSCWSNSLKYS